MSADADYSVPAGRGRSSPVSGKSVSAWASQVATVNGIRMHYVRAGEGPLLLLLHGWPQTWYAWRKMITPLASTYTVVVPDLRGYGRTDKPTSGYDKRTMATDVRALVEYLGHSSVAVVGHDRGARVAHRLGLDHPGLLDKFVALDVLPTRAVLNNMDATLAPGMWHWFFHLQPDLPELLVTPQIQNYLQYFFERWSYDRGSLEPEAIEEYVRAFSAPGALRAGFDDYRATPLDREHDDASVAEGHRLQAPVLVLWGSTGLLQGNDSILKIWGEYATRVEGTVIQECGHFLPEERPNAVLDEVLSFLS